MSHNRVEQLFREEKFKTKFCTFYPNNLESCEYGSYCCFAHTEEEIAIELLHNYTYDDDFYLFHFKTVWCPFNLSYHDKALCVYAHNWQDFRRKPSTFSYKPEACPNWNLKDFIYVYSDGCPNSNSCKFSHGWKELEFHPLSYKTKPCKIIKKCQDLRGCPNFHFLSEKREIPRTVLFNLTKFVPRNRYVSGTFKKREFFDWTLKVLLPNKENYQSNQHFTSFDPKFKLRCIKDNP